MLSALCLSSVLLNTVQAPVVPRPRYTLNVRNAPTSAVFAMMLDEGSTITVMRHFPRFVTLRLTEAQVTLPPPENPGRGYGDYWPIGGWLKGMEGAMGVSGLVLGHEREGGAFYVSRDGMPNTAGYDDYEGSIRSSGGWHRVWATGRGEPVALPADVTSADFRLAAVRWTGDPDSCRAVLVVRTKSGEAFTRVVKKGDSLGVAGIQITGIEGTEAVLSGPPSEQVRLALRG